MTGYFCRRYDSIPVANGVCISCGLPPEDHRDPDEHLAKIKSREEFYRSDYLPARRRIWRERVTVYGPVLLMLAAMLLVGVAIGHEVF